MLPSCLHCRATQSCFQLMNTYSPGQRFVYTWRTFISCQSWVSMISTALSFSLIVPFPKQLQLPRSTVQTTFVSIKCVTHIFWSCHCHDQEGKTNYHLLLRENWSGWSRANQKPQKASLQWIRGSWRKGDSVSSQVCFRSTRAERLPSLQTLQLQARLAVDKEKNLLEENSLAQILCCFLPLTSDQLPKNS